jgi:hypothetical protein
MLLLVLLLIKISRYKNVEKGKAQLIPYSGKGLTKSRPWGEVLSAGLFHVKLKHAVTLQQG